MALTDGDVAALAEQAARRIPGPVRIRVEPDAGDDPYRWGRHSWLVHFDRGERRDGRGVRVSAEESEQEAADRLADGVAALLAGDGPA